jgi:ribose transport system substrate-binding protein
MSRPGPRTVLFVLLLVAAIVFAVGCGSKSSDSGTGSASATGAGGAPLKSIAFANVTDASPLFKAVGDRLVSLGKRNSVEVKRFDNKFDASVALQNARLMAQQKPDVLIDWSVTADANSAIGKQFTSSGKPCIAVNFEIPGCVWFNLSNFDLGLDLGPVAAKEATKRGWTGANTSVILLNVPSAGPEALELVQGFYTSFAKGFSGVKQVTKDQITATTSKIGDNVYVLDGKALLDVSNKVVRQVLQQIPKSRHLVLLGPNDDSALGGLRAIQQAGRADDLVMVSNGADQQGLTQLRDNAAWVAEGAVFTAIWPDYILAMAKAIHAGAKLPHLTPSPQLVVTKDDADQYFNADGSIKSPPEIPAGAKYLEKYGLRGPA